jgi:outer membrane protein TolC
MSARAWILVGALALPGALGPQHAITASAGADSATAPRMAGSAGAADTLKLSLDQAIAAALEQGVDMKIANAEVSAASGRIRELGSAALPQITGSFDYTRRFDSIFRDAGAAGTDTIFGPLLENTPFAAVNLWTFDITAKQTIFSRRIGSAIGVAKSYRERTAATRTETASDVRLRTTEAYLWAASAKRLAEIATAGLEQATGHFKQVQLYYKQGTRAEYDMIQAQVDAMNAEPPVVAARNEYEMALLDLKHLLNIPLGRPMVLVTPAGFDDGMVPVTNVDEPGPAQRAALVAANAEVQGREHLLDVERGARWPELVVTGTVSQQAFPGDQLPSSDQFRRNIEATARLEFPLFLGLRTFGSIQRATAELHQAEVRRVETQQAVELEIERARHEVRRTLSVMLARGGTVSLAKRAYHLASVRYTNGLSTQLEVSDARLQMLTTEGRAVLAARDYRVALAQLQHALGRSIPMTMQLFDELTLSITNGDGAATAASPVETRGSR